MRCFSSAASAPVKDEKFDILKHPNVRLTTDGGTEPYFHGSTERAIATLCFAKADGQVQPTSEPQRNIDLSQYELLSEADLQEQFKEVKSNETLS